MRRPDSEQDWPAGDVPASTQVLVVDLGHFEGPLDLLLDLARKQKVDLTGLSILALAEQYLAFVAEAKRQNLELAADYLVMAAWLAYLKSRLLLPKPPRDPEEPSAEDLAVALAERLRRLASMRAAASWLEERPILGSVVFARGTAPADAGEAEGSWSATLHDLVAAYLRQRQRRDVPTLVIRERYVWTLAEAREALERVVGALRDWMVLDALVLTPGLRVQDRRSHRASGLAAALELAREGRCDLSQHAPFAPLMIGPPAAGVTP